MDNTQAVISSAVFIHNFLIDLKEPFIDELLKDEKYQALATRLEMNDILTTTQTSSKFRLRNHLIENFF